MVVVVGTVLVVLVVLEVLECTAASFRFDIIIGEVLGFGLGVTFAAFGIIPPTPPPKVNFDIDPVGSNAGALLDSVDEEATILA